MSNLTFLTTKQCDSPDSIYSVTSQLKILQKRGGAAAITDFAILCGGEVSDVFNKDGYVKNDNSLEGRTGYYWTKSNRSYTFADNHVDIFGYIGCCDARVCRCSVGGRPALPFSSINSIPTNGEIPKRASDGVLEVEYGYYPQKAASRYMQDELDYVYRSGYLSKTGNVYTTDSREYYNKQKDFLAKRYEEYEYEGKRYLKVKANSYYKQFVLSNQIEYNNGDYVWVEIFPVKWLVDKNSHMMVTEKIIFAGVPFNNTGKYQNFNETTIKRFMDDYLSKELVQIEYCQVKHNDLQKQQPQLKEVYKFDYSNVTNMDIVEMAIKSNVAVFLHGKVGCGKSARVKQLDSDFTELNLNTLDPELLDGIAGEKNGEGVHLKPPWLKELEKKCEKEPNKTHIVFLEELTNATDLMKKKALGIILDHKVAGTWNLPKNARIVAAGNELEDSCIAEEMPESLFGRFAHVYIETKAKDWLEWAITQNKFYEPINYKEQERSRTKIHPAIYAFISYKGDKALRTNYDRDNPKPYADPRRWEMASDMLYKSNNPNILKAIVGEELTKEFIEFCKNPTLTLKEILEGSYLERDLRRMSLAQKILTVAKLVKVDNKNMPKIREFIKNKLDPEMCESFEIQWVGEDKERLRILQEIIQKEKEIVNV